MEQWARESILQHNALMNAAWQIVTCANAYCQNTDSEKIEAMLEIYEVCAETGEMKNQEEHQDDNQ